MTLQVSYHGTVVTVSGQVAPDNRATCTYTPTPGASDGILPVNGVVTLRNGPQTDFDALLSRAHHVLGHYHAGQLGSTWGCNGVGYIAQKNSGEVIVHKSGIGPRKFTAGETARRACDKCR